MLVVSTTAHAQFYAQGAITGTDSKLGGGHSVSADIGVVYKAFDFNVGLFSATQRLNNGNAAKAASDISWTGISASAAAHYPIFEKVTAFAGYQVYDNAYDKLDGRYGVGLAAHLGNIKLNFIIAPAQNGWHNSNYDTLYAVSIKYRFDLR